MLLYMLLYIFIKLYVIIDEVTMPNFIFTYILQKKS